MSAQPAENVHPIGNPMIPQFEGLPVTSATMRIAGLSVVNAENLPIVRVDDRVRLVGEFKVVGVRHTVDKNGDVVREQILTPIAVDTCPFDVGDPADDGVIRAR